MKSKSVRKSSFTLVEIIAVLIIIAIMAAVAIPRFISLADEARDGVTQAGINEAKASLSVAYAKAFVAKSGGAVTALEVMDNLSANLASGGTVTFGDVVVTFTASGQNITLAAAGLSGSPAAGGTASGTFTVP